MTKQEAEALVLEAQNYIGQTITKPNLKGYKFISVSNIMTTKEGDSPETAKVYAILESPSKSKSQHSLTLVLNLLRD